MVSLSLKTYGSSSLPEESESEPASLDQDREEPELVSVIDPLILELWRK